MVGWTRVLSAVWVVVVWEQWGAVGASGGEMGDVGHLGIGGVQKRSLCSKQYEGILRVLSHWVIW